MTIQPCNLKSMIAALVLGGLTLLCGCRDEEISTEYGRRTGVRPKESVNGTTVLGDLFSRAGHSVRSKQMLTNQLREYAEVIVWAPDDFAPPSPETVDWLDEWLSQGGRTLIYIGRDFDAAPGYYQKVLPGAPAAQVAELKRRQAEVSLHHQTNRSSLPNNSECSWFTIDNTRKLSSVSQLAGPWSDGLDASKVEIQLHSRLRPKRYACSVRQRTAGSYEDGEATWAEDVNEENLWEDEEGDDDGAVNRDENGDDDEDKSADTGLLQPQDNGVLLRSGQDILISRQECDGTNQSEIILVANGSFLLNLPLVNHQHRALGTRLVDHFETSEMVVFLESGRGGPKIVDKEPSVSIPSGLMLFSQRPLDVILFHLVALGIILSVARWPIFGRPRKPAKPQVSDFGKHVDALGDLLQQTGNREFAEQMLSNYRQKSSELNG
jgi:hypothetical protein